MSDRFQSAIARFDAANARDPSEEALAYSQRMTDWLGRIAPDASEAVQLAARCQHIRRWEIPRTDYPMDRQGYHQWRTTLGKFHAEVAGQILKEVGYDDAVIARVQSLLRKERLKADPETQLLEDVICLVFLEFYFADFAIQHDDAKVINILRRTWAKMSPRGHSAATELLPRLSANAQRLIKQALTPSPAPAEPASPDASEDL